MASVTESVKTQLTPVINTFFCRAVAGLLLDGNFTTTESVNTLCKELCDLVIRVHVNDTELFPKYALRAERESNLEDLVATRIGGIIHGLSQKGIPKGNLNVTFELSKGSFCVRLLDTGEDGYLLYVNKEKLDDALGTLVNHLVSNK